MTIQKNQLKHLESIYKNQEARQELERIANSSVKLFNEMELDFGALRAADEAKNFILKTTEKLALEYGLDKYGLTLYIALDVYASPIMNNREGRQIGAFAVFENEQYPQIGRKTLHGDKIERVYGEDMPDIINFVEENLHLLPDSLQKEVERLKREYSFRPKISMILNEFEMKVYVSSLSKKFNPEVIMAHLNIFGWIGAASQKINTYYYFRRAIQEKYEGAELEKAQYVLGKTLDKLLKALENTSIPWAKFHRDTFVEIFKKDESFLKELSDLAKDDKTQAILEKMKKENGIQGEVSE